MLIANPIYDVVFKRLMQNTRIARFFIETLTGETLDETDLQPQEFVYADEQKILAVSRYDFVASIKTADGEHKKVLIEIQKARNAIDVMRFRNYLGEQYKKEDTLRSGEKKPLPIIAIYLLGFNLDGIDSAAVKVRRGYMDMLTGEAIAAKSDFIEHLTHDCYVVQLSKIRARMRNSLEQLLAVFEQGNFIDDRHIVKEFEGDTTNEVIRDIVGILHLVGTDPANRKEIENEVEGWRTIDAMGGEKLRQMAIAYEEVRRDNAQKDKTIADKEKTIVDKEKTIVDKENTIVDKENTIADKEKTIADKEKMIADREKMLADREQALKEANLLIQKEKAEREAMEAELNKLKRER